MGQGKRTVRVAEELRKVVGEIITTRLKQSEVGFVTLTRVDVSPDLKSARIFYTSLGTEVKREKVQDNLDEYCHMIQSEIARTMRLRFTPKLKFIYDTGAEETFKIQSILNKIHNEQKSDDLT